MESLFAGMTTAEIIKTLAPFLVLELGLKAFCIYLIVTKGVKNLSKGIWVAIVLFVSTIGSIAYLIAGRKTD